MDEIYHPGVKVYSVPMVDTAPAEMVLKADWDRVVGLLRRLERLRSRSTRAEVRHFLAGIDDAAV